MISLKAFIAKCAEKCEHFSVRYVHPSLYLIITDDRFSGLNDEERTSLFFSALGFREQDYSFLLSSSNVILSLVSEEERMGELSFLDGSENARHWIEFLATTQATELSDTPGAQKIIHFYGFKGGQGRSTVLSMLARASAEDGYRVLVVDADIEAPSLPSQFGVRLDTLESSLLGCVQFGLEPAPQQVFVSRTTSGSIDLLACKPSGPEYDLDLAIFALNTALDPARLERAFKRILASSLSYDLVLVDHRSGISSSVLPLVSAFPGPTVICVRLDEQSDEADEYVRVLLGRNPHSPGLFVSFSLDPEDTSEKMRSRSGARIESLLDILASSIAVGSDGGVEDESVELTPDALQPYWIPWFHDRSFMTRPAPNVQDILSVNKEALSKIRDVIGFSGPQRGATRASTTINGPRALTNSGSTDEGILIETDALRKLRAPNSNYRYIFGRKGTGKTRLVRALVEENLGTTILSAEDDGIGGSISSADPLFLDIAAFLFKNDAPDKLWWIALDCALSAPGTSVTDSLQNWLTDLTTLGVSSIRTSDIARRLQLLEEPRVFLIDGVETAFTSVQMPVFVQGLFRFLGVIQANAQIANKVIIRLFLRTDLVQFGSENVEQQVDGRSLTLSWDTQSILNFALSRIAALPWFRKNFETTVKQIESKANLLSEGEVPSDECGEILLQVFPTNFRRNNLLTLTFLKTYFSEGEGDTASFYPRIYDAFLRGIDRPNLIGPSAVRLPQIEDGHVGQQLIVKAHDYASEQYLQQVAAELRNLVRLSDDVKENARRVEVLLPMFRGLPTPFKVSECLQAVHLRLSAEFNVDRDAVKSALDEMKRVGIFEDRPGYGGWWRAGRLFKNALGMKYVR